MARMYSVKVIAVSWPRQAPPGAGSQRLGAVSRAGSASAYSHSIVAGGFEEMSRATRFTPGISLMIRPEIASRTS